MATSDDLPFTGERFIPGVDGEIWIEHWHRYHFAARSVTGLRVLDVACGEGYGSAFLARQAAQVVGVDIAPAAIRHAQARYGSIANLQYREASCTALPFADASFDCVVSFETLEHIEAQRAFLAEVRRVLKPDGLFILSSPNKAEYTDRLNYDNTYHVRELYRAELAELVGAVFPHIRWLGQKNGFFSVIWPEGEPAPTAEVVTAAKDSASEAAHQLDTPLYFLLYASGVAARVTREAARLSLFADAGEWLYNDYRQVVKDLRHLHARHNELHALLIERTRAMQAADHEVLRLRALLGARGIG